MSSSTVKESLALMKPHNRFLQIRKSGKSSVIKATQDNTSHMIREVVGFLGVISTLVPNRIIDLFERLAIDNHEDRRERSWFSPMIRAEGLLITVVCLLKGRPYAWMMNLTGAFGAVILFFPDLYRKLAAMLLYEEPEQVEWKDRFATGVRLIGALYILLSVHEFRKRRAYE